MYFRKKISGGRVYLPDRREPAGRRPGPSAGDHHPRPPRSAPGEPGRSSTSSTETIRGHVFCSFLALVLKSELGQRIAALGHDGSWSEILADLNSLTRPRSITTTSASSSAPARAPLPASRSAPPASPCRPPSGPSPATDPSPKCSATPLPRRGLPFALRYLAKITVEDGSESDHPRVRGLE